jgi:hypothetical protein
VSEQYSDSMIRQVIRHSAKRILLAGKSAVVKYTYDGNKLYAIYDSGDGQREAYEVQIELLADNSILPEAEPEHHAEWCNVPHPAGQTPCRVVRRVKDAPQA